MAGGHPAAPLALDTNPFLLLVTYRYLKSKNATALERMLALSDVRDQSDYVEPWSAFTLHYRYRQTPYHIRITRLPGAPPGGTRLSLDGQALAGNAISLLDDFRVEEHSCPILDLHANGDYRKVLIALGYTDAGLLHTAERHKATLITEDTKLLSFAYARLVPAFPLSQLRALIAQSR